MLLGCTAALLSLVISSCTRKLWTEFHASGSNQGVLGVHTSPAERYRWAVNVGPAFYSSPAVTQDGTVYIGTGNGELVGVQSGNIRIRDKLTGQLSSPAYGPDGRLYVAMIADLGGSKYSGALFSLTPLAKTTTMNWWNAFPDNGYTTASPKIWGSPQELNIFLPVHSSRGQELFIFNQQGNIVHREVLCQELIGGGSFSWEDFGKVLVGILTGGWSAIGWGPEFRVRGLDVTLTGPRHPSVAIFEGHGTTEPGNPIIVVAPNGCPLQAFEWSAGEGKLNRLWIHNDSADTYSSPVALAGEFIIGEGKHLKSYELKTGKELWDYDVGTEVLATPAVFFGLPQVYMVAGKHVDRVEDGKRVPRYDLPEETLASPALSWDYIYISAPSSLYTLTFDLVLKERDGRSLSGPPPIKGGLSSPAVGSDGEIYAATTDGWLVEFPR